MTKDTDNNETKQPDAEDTQSSEYSSCCEPGCGCGKPPGKDNTKLKIAVCLVVVVAIAGILIFKTTSVRQKDPSLSGVNGFSNTLTSKGAITNSSGQQGGRGVSLSAIADLNTVAAKLDTVFLIIPSKDNSPPTKETGAILTSVERTLNKKGLSTGIYTLKATSPDYTDVAAKVTPPGIAVLTKGRGIGFVSGRILEPNLMQAYVASMRGGCCPTGGSSPAKPCN